MIKEKNFVLLQPVVKRFPNRHCIYFPKEDEPLKKVTFVEFRSKFIQSGHEIRLCKSEAFTLDEMIRLSEPVMAYSYGLGYWYTVLK